MNLNEIQLGYIAHLAAVGLLYAALLMPPSILSHTKLALAFLPPIWGCHVYSWSVGLGFLAAIQVLWATELLLFRYPREKFQVIHRRDLGSTSPNPKGDMDATSQKGKESEKDNKKEQSRIWKEPYPTSFWKRFWWVFKLLVSMRYVGWDIGDMKTTVPRRRQSYISWLLRNILFVGICFFLVDAMNFYQRFDPYFQIETNIDEAFPRGLDGFLTRYHLSFLPPRLLRITVLGFHQYAVFAVINSVMAIIHVTLGALGMLDDFWGGMENWPPLMGNPLVVLESDLRGFWGRFWHQLFRNVRDFNVDVELNSNDSQLLIGPAKALAAVLRVPPKSLPAYIIQVVLAFILSGAIHAASLPRNIPNVSPLRYASFFWIQGACVLVEIALEQVLVLQGSGELRPLWVRSCLAVARLAWTVGILYFTVPVGADELMKVARIVGPPPVFLFPLPKK